MKTPTSYRVVHIKSESDLPKESGIYWSQITESSRGSFHFNPNDKDDIDFFIGNVEFYLLPVFDEEVKSAEEFLMEKIELKWYLEQRPDLKIIIIDAMKKYASQLPVKDNEVTDEKIAEVNKCDYCISHDMSFLETPCINCVYGISFTAFENMFKRK